MSINRAVFGVLFLCFCVTRFDVLDSRAAEPKIRWPHCEIVNEGLNPRPLADAIAELNVESLSHPVGASQKPVLLAETILAIEDVMTDKHISDDVKGILKKIVQTKTLPENAFFRRFSRLDDGQVIRGVWWIRLMVKTEAPTISSVPIRNDYLWSRPYTQMERKQRAQNGLSLINRFVSYFESPPSERKSVNLSDALKDQLVMDVKNALADRDLERLKKLFIWRKSTEATRKFVGSELSTLVNSTVHSVSFQTRKLDGNLIHWSAFSHFRPNVPVIGYVNIVFTPGGDLLGRMKTLSLEVGQAGSRLWFVNYIYDKADEMPKRLGGMSISGANELLPGNMMHSYTTIQNPGVLLSAHIANEEVWHHNLTLRRQPPAANVVGNEIVKQREHEKSERLKDLFTKLDIGPRLQHSWHARDLPELYERREDNFGRFQTREGVFSEHYDVGIKYTPEGELIWLDYLAKTKRYYLRHRWNRSEPYDDRIFGPYEGNLFELLPELEQNWLVRIREGDTNVSRTLRRMLEQNDTEMAGRVLKLMDKTMYFYKSDELRERHETFKTYSSWLNQYQSLFDSIPDERRLQSVQNRIDEHARQIENVRMSFPIDEYETENEKLKLPVEIAEELWGKASNGLRCALVPPASMRHDGNPFDAVLVIENVSDSEIKICLSQGVGSYPTIKLDGASVMVGATYMGGFQLNQDRRYLVKPKRRIAVGTMRVLPEKTDQHDARPMYHERQHTVVPFSPSMIELGREYRIGTSVYSGEMDLWRNVDGKAKIYRPAKGEWTGKIHTSGFKLKLTKEDQS